MQWSSIVSAVVLAACQVVQSTGTSDAFLPSLYNGYPYEFAIINAARQEDTNALQALYAGYEWEPKDKFQGVNVDYFTPQVRQLLSSGASNVRYSPLGTTRQYLPADYQEVYLQLYGESQTVASMIFICNSNAAACRYMVLNREFPVFQQKLLGLTEDEQMRMTTLFESTDEFSDRSFRPIYQMQIELVSRLLEVNDQELRDLFVWALLNCRGGYDGVTAHVIAFGLGYFEAKNPYNEEKYRRLIRLLASGYRYLADAQQDPIQFQYSLTKYAIDMAGGAKVNRAIKEETYRKVSHRKGLQLSLSDNGDWISPPKFQPWGYLAVLVTAEYEMLDAEMWLLLFGRISKFLCTSEANDCLFQQHLAESSRGRDSVSSVGNYLNGWYNKYSSMRLALALSLARSPKLYDYVDLVINHGLHIKAGLESSSIMQRIAKILLRFSLSIALDQSSNAISTRISRQVKQGFFQKTDIIQLLIEFNEQFQLISGHIGEISQSVIYQNLILNEDVNPIKLRDVNVVIGLLKSQSVTLDDIVQYEMARVEKERGSFDFALLTILFRKGFQLTKPVELMEKCLHNGWYRLFSLLRQNSRLNHHEVQQLVNLSEHHPWYMALHKEKSWRRSIAMALQRLRHWNSFYN
ncbi:hypothetical protein MP228_002469 [Amoeboaphelidium protococcarum]|nr:hypothetical protein MP228_002469 [Amoeboaphelidium protococcarum]